MTSPTPLPAYPAPLPPLGTYTTLSEWHTRAILERNYERERVAALHARLYDALLTLTAIAECEYDSIARGLAKELVAAIGPLPEAM